MGHVVYLFTYPKFPQLASKLIRWRLKTDYSHVCIAIYVPPLKMYRVYQASHGSVHIVSLENFLKYNNVIKSVSTSSIRHHYFNALKWIEQQTGKKYGIWTALASTFKIARRFKIGDNDDSKFICSELAYGCYTRQKNKKELLNADYVDPKDFEKLIYDNGHNVQKGMIIKL